MDVAVLLDQETLLEFIDIVEYFVQGKNREDSLLIREALKLVVDGYIGHMS